MNNVVQLHRLRQQFPNEFVAIGVHSAKFPTEKLTENIREAVMREGIEHPVVNDAGFQIWNEYAVRAWPTLVLIDPQGKIDRVESGEIDADEWIPIIQNLVSEFEAKGQLNRQPLDIEPEAKSEPQRPLSFPSKIYMVPDGRLFIADTGHHRVLELRLEPDGKRAEILRFFGSGQPGFQDGPAETAAFHNPRGMALVHENLYVADTDNHTIRAIDLPTGNVRTVAGTGKKGTGRAAGENPTQVDLRAPWDLVALEGAGPDKKDILLIAMAGSHQIWLLIGEERLGVFAGNGREALVDGPLPEASFNQPSGLALGWGYLFVADAEASAIRVISLTEAPKVFTMVGQGLFEFGDEDGSGPIVRLQHPTGVAFSDSAFPAGSTLKAAVYIADSYNHKIKILDPLTGQVNTLAGSGQPGHEDGLFEQAGFYEPEGLDIYQDILYIADTNNHLIRLADLKTRQVYTLSLTLLDRLQPAQKVIEGKSLRLEPVKIRSGPIRVIFDILLPPGYKLNPDAPVSLLRVQDGGGVVTSFTPDVPVTLGFEAIESHEMIVDLVVYYCREGNQGLCLIDDRRVVIPLRVDPDAPAEVHIPYIIQ